MLYGAYYQITWLGAYLFQLKLVNGKQRSQPLKPVAPDVSMPHAAGSTL